MSDIILPTEAETLYFGFDESNHASCNDRKGEIVVALVSTKQEDGIVRGYPNHRINIGFLDRTPEYDYRFTILIGDKFLHNPSSDTLTEVAPFLVEPFLHDGLKCLKLYLDGIMKKGQKDFLRRNFAGVEKVVVDSFVKKSISPVFGKRKQIRCPRTVYLADSLASSLYHTSTGELLSHPKFMPYSQG